MTEVQIIAPHRPQALFRHPYYATMLGGHHRRTGPPSTSSNHSSPRGGLGPDFLLLTASPPSSSHHDYYSMAPGASDGEFSFPLFSSLPIATPPLPNAPRRLPAEPSLAHVSVGVAHGSSSPLTSCDIDVFTGFNFDTFTSPFPPPLPAAGPSSGNELFDPSEKNALSQFLDQVESGAGDTDAYGFPAFWDDGTQSEYPTTPLADHAYSPVSSTAMGHHIPAVSYGLDPLDSMPITINPFESALHLRQRSPPKVEAPSLVWGSDPHFAGGSGFGPAPLPQLITTTDTAIQQRVRSILVAGENSPARNNNDNPELDFKALGLDTSLDTFSPSSLNTPHTPLTSAKKRRAFDPPDGSDTSKPDSPADKLEPPPKRKKKGGGRRDNLTEDQKRENHIQSEQKRRDLIRQGFNDLCSLVPELREGGYSKSVVLMHAANFLEDLKTRVESLRGYVASLEGQR